MQRTFWILLAALALAVMGSVVVPKLSAQQRACARLRSGQAPEAQALLAQEWARAHGHPGH